MSFGELFEFKQIILKDFFDFVFVSQGAEKQQKDSIFFQMVAKIFKESLYDFVTMLSAADLQFCFVVLLSLAGKVGRVEKDSVKLFSGFLV